MAEGEGTEPVADEERLFRRVPVSMGWFSDNALSPEAFDPRPDDDTGISVYREKYKDIEAAASGKSAQGYFVAVLRAGDLRQHGIDIEPCPLDGDPGHAQLPGLKYGQDKQQLAERKLRLARLAAVEGPFLQQT